MKKELKKELNKNLSVNVSETDTEIWVKIEPAVDLKKKVFVEYRPIDFHEKGIFCLGDSPKSIEIERSFMISRGDDVDWDFESIYPCQKCLIQRWKDDEIRELRKENLKLQKTLVNLLVERTLDKSSD